MNSASSLMRLDTQQFVTDVLALEPQVAVFDCDGTLWSGDAGSAFMAWSMETGLLSSYAAGWMRSRYAAYRDGDVSELTICGDMVQVYAGQTVETLRAAAAEFFAASVEPHIFPELQRLVEQLQQRGVDLWAVSSTNDWVIEEGVQRFGLPPDRVLAARVEAEGGLVTDRLIDVPTDEGKVAALARAGVLQPQAVFGNSVHDAAMLAIARRAFPVNPTPALVALSAERGWPVYFPAAVSPA